jgi:hypothetical protein
VLAVLLLVRREAEPQPARRTAPPAPEAMEAEEIEAEEEEPIEPASSEPVVPQPAPPAAQAVADTPGSSAEVTELLVLSRRIESTDPQRSRELLRQALAIDPNDETALERLSKKLFLDEQPSAAGELVERCRREHEDNTDCKALAVEIPDPASRDASRKNAETCVQQTPENLLCVYSLLDGALAQGDQSAARLFGLRLSNLAPKSAISELALGRITANSGDYAGARAYFDEACRLGSQAACLRAKLLREEGF